MCLPSGLGHAGSGRALRLWLLVSVGASCGQPAPGADGDDGTADLAGEADEGDEIHDGDAPDDVGLTDDAEDTDAPPDCSPSATEQCNGLDDDCDGLTDEGLLQLIDPVPLDMETGQEDYEYLVYGVTTTPIPDGWAAVWTRTPRLDGSGRPMAAEDPTAYLTVTDAAGGRAAGPVAVFSGTVRPPAPVAIRWTGTDLAFVVIPWNFAGTPADVLFGRSSRAADVTLTPVHVLGFDTGMGAGPLAGGPAGVSGWVYVFWSPDVVDELLMFAGIDGVGALIGTPTQLLAEAPTSTNGGTPAAVWTGSDYGIAWRGKLLRVGGDGVALGEPIALTGRVFGSAIRSALAWNGSNWGTAWSGCCGLPDTCAGSGDSNGVLFARFDHEGFKIGDDACLTPTTSYRWEARLAARDREFAVGWSDGSIPGSPGPSCDTGYVQRLTDGGDPIGEPIRLGDCEGGPAEVFPTARGYAVLMSNQRIMRIECPP